MSTGEAPRSGNTSAGGEVTVTIIRMGDWPRTEKVPHGTLVKDLSARLNMRDAERVPVRDADGNVLGPNTPFTQDVSVSYSYKVAGASA